jgi:uncharacterized protein YdeI (YjbR/CyaY-like superfamily)
LRFFDSAAAFRQWLAKHHASQSELLVGFYKTKSGRGGLTYAQAVDEALCFGWIDGVRHGIDADSYSIRFTPRKKRSIWSAVNLRHVARLEKAGRMAAAGLKVFRERDPKRAGIYSFENRPRTLAPSYRKEFAANRQAWAWFSAQPPWYRRTAAFWVMSGKKEQTQRRRLAVLIASSERERRAPPFSYSGRAGE